MSEYTIRPITLSFVFDTLPEGLVVNRSLAYVQLFHRVIKPFCSVTLHLQFNKYVMASIHSYMELIQLDFISVALFVELNGARSAVQSEM